MSNMSNKINIPKTIGKTKLEIGLRLWDNINKKSLLAILKPKYNEDGVQFVKDNYIDGQPLFDLIFPKIYNLNDISKDNLKIVWYHGRDKETVNATVSAGLPGIHVYMTPKKIIGIIIRNA